MQGAFDTLSRGHPIDRHGTPRLLTDRELHNFGTFMANGGFDTAPRGACDGAPARRRGPGGIDLRHFGPGGAFDAAAYRTSARYRLGFDARRGAKDDVEGAGSATQRLLARLAAKLSPDDFEDMKDEIFEMCGRGVSDPTEDDELPDDMGEDDPPDFPGMPRTGGTMAPLKRKPAMDSRRATAARSFASMHPDAARLAADALPSVAPPVDAPSQQARNSFAEMFPGAMDIGIGGVTISPRVAHR